MGWINDSNSSRLIISLFFHYNIMASSQASFLLLSLGVWLALANMTSAELTLAVLKNAVSSDWPTLMLIVAKRKTYLGLSCLFQDEEKNTWGSTVPAKVPSQAQDRAEPPADCKHLSKHSWNQQDHDMQYGPQISCLKHSSSEQIRTPEILKK